MQFNVQKNTKQPTHSNGGTPAHAGACSRVAEQLSLYLEPPTENITLDEFERLALERLRVLKGLEDAKLRNKSEPELQDLVQKLLQKHLKGSSPEASIRADHISHYILRLAYCRTAELRKWLLTHECEMFRLRFNALELASDKVAFLQESALPYQPVADKELTAEIVEALRRVLASTGEGREKVTDLLAEGRRTFYKVPFTAVPDLVQQRKVLLMQGFAYVSKQDLTSLVVQEFRLGVSKGLADISRRWRDMFPDTDTRLRPLVASLSQRYLGMDYSSGVGAKHGEVHLADLPLLTQKHFPLCMSNLMGHLAVDHHLKHGGRQQLGLFLKAIGLPMEEALMFWRTSFAQRVPSDKFEKEYAYNIRHNYGKEGKRADYSAHSCVSLIRQTAGRDDHHGCPYRRLDEPTLRSLLAQRQCEESKIEEALAKVRGGHYQLACGLVLEGTAHAPCDTGICHPVQYYTESRRTADERDPTRVSTSGIRKEDGAEGVEGSVPLDNHRLPSSPPCAAAALVQAHGMAHRCPAAL